MELDVGVVVEVAFATLDLPSFLAAVLDLPSSLVTALDLPSFLVIASLAIIAS